MSEGAATVERLFAAMKGSRGFAALENTVTAVINTLGNEKCRASELVGHIVEDFALTQKVLKLANSPMYAPFRAGSANVSAALGVLGKDAILHIVLSTTMVSDVELEGDETLSKTLIASELARSICAGRSEDVSIAALMYDLGSLLTHQYLPQEAVTLDQKIAAGQNADAAAGDVFGITLPQLGAEVAARWKLPASIVSLIDGTGDPDLVAIARFASTASGLIHCGKLDEVDQLVAELNVPGVDTSGVGSLIRSKAALIKHRNAVATVPAVTNESVLDDLFAALDSDKKQTVEALAAAMFATFASTLQTAHCLLFMVTRTGDFAIRYGYGKGVEELRSKLRISKDYKPNAFHAAIKNNVDVSIADVSRLKTTALPDGFTELLPHVNQFVILPIARSGVSGLLYCDWDCEKVLSQSELDAVKKLRGLFLPFFPA